MVKDEMTDVTGRVLQPPSILYGGRVGGGRGWEMCVGARALCLPVVGEQQLWTPMGQRCCQRCSPGRGQEFLPHSSKPALVMGPQED